MSSPRDRDRDRIPTNPGHRSPLPGARPAILEAADDHDVLRDLAGVVYERVVPVIEDLAVALPDLMTHAKCDAQRAKDHPGARRWLVDAAIVAGLLGALWGGWQWLISPVLARVDRAVLAAEFRRDEPPAPIPIPVLVPVARPLDAAAPPPKPWASKSRRRQP